MHSVGALNALNVQRADTFKDVKVPSFRKHNKYDYMFVVFVISMVQLRWLGHHLMKINTL